ncbi:MAG TPA: signal peptidase I [Candidatus Limnocylindrales bacterium]|jgi:signal peptidase|nr:signal peptidase I [Candidatus Limnocylindrales bacterium]
MAIGWRGWRGAALAAVLATLVPLTTFLVSVWLLGWQLQHVQSGSMSPTYPVGSLLVTAQIDPADVRMGMPIVFDDPREPGRLVTHRVVGIVPGPALAFVTRGDANATNDPSPVPSRLVRGHVLWSVTYLGTVLDWLQWPRSFIVLVVVPAALLLIAEMRGLVARRRRVPSIAT